MTDEKNPNMGSTKKMILDSLETNDNEESIEGIPNSPVLPLFGSLNVNINNEEELSVNNAKLRDEAWLARATEAELRDYLRNVIEQMEEGEEKNRQFAAFDRECDRRSGAYNESLNNGEWI